MGRFEDSIIPASFHAYLSLTLSGIGHAVTVALPTCIPFRLSLRGCTPASWSTASASDRRWRRLLLLQIEVHVYRSLLLASSGICFVMGPLLPLQIPSRVPFCASLPLRIR